MAKENGSWIMYGLRSKDPGCIHNTDELIAFINEVGFVPLFKNHIEGFSIEEHTIPEDWWCGNPKTDPWEWRQYIASSGKACYGKFFWNKAGFISKKWLPYFVNYRRDGYDFEGYWNDGLASRRQKKIMDLIDEDTEMFSNELKSHAGFGKGGEKNFEGTITSLQMSMYLCVRDFEQRINKQGEGYGWPVAVYSMPEHIFGEKTVTKAFAESPAESYQRIVKHMKKFYNVSDKDLKKL